MKLIVKNGVIHDAVHPQPYEADLLLEDGKIAAIGKDFSGAEVIDAQGLQIYPGFVDAHSHIGLDGFGMGYEGMDYNEMNDICSPQLRAIDGINPMDETFALARAGVRAGFPRPLAQDIATQAVLGSAKLVQESGEHPMALVDQVCSPAGTTIEGIFKLQELGFEDAVHQAIDAIIQKDDKIRQG